MGVKSTNISRVDYQFLRRIDVGVEGLFIDLSYIPGKDVRPLSMVRHIETGRSTRVLVDARGGDPSLEHKEITSLRESLGNLNPKLGT